MVKQIQLSKIRTDGGTQMRAELNRDIYFEYRDKWAAGEEFPPVVLFHDGSTYWLADGFHRFYGAREAKLETIPADVRQGTVRDAILFAVAANQQHGMRRTNADKRRSVEALLNDEEWCKWSDRKVAEQAGVSDPFVSSIRKELLTVSSSPAAKVADQPRTGKDGKARKQPTPTPKPTLTPKVSSPTPPPPERNKIIPVPDHEEEEAEEGEEEFEPAENGSIAQGLVPLLDAQKAVDAIFAPLNKAEREELFEYVNYRYGPKEAAA